jgi:hypothetical protein
VTKLEKEKKEPQMTENYRRTYYLEDDSTGRRDYYEAKPHKAMELLDSLDICEDRVRELKTKVIGINMIVEAARREVISDGFRSVDMYNAMEQVWGTRIFTEFLSEVLSEERVEEDPGV